MPYVRVVTLAVLLIGCLQSVNSQWLKQESEHFRVVYRESHSHLVSHIIESSETALSKLRTLFNYTPTEKITINTFDVNDWGAGAATTVPRNYIWLDLAPMEPGYENIPYTERIRWLLTHELVHIVVNDLATSTEASARAIFSKVAPEQIEPLSILYSVITNFSRYTPRWHQEGIAVFLETWMSGGFGRAMGSFDEMYFRSLVDEGKEFPDDIRLETRVPHKSFLVEMNYYIYGGRFAMHLIDKYGPEKLVRWYTSATNDFYVTFTTKFEEVYGISFDEGWKDFTASEKKFQLENIARLKSSPLTSYRRLAKAIGAVSHPHRDSSGRYIIWGEHRPNSLADIQRFDLQTLQSEQLATLKTPSLHQVSSTAFDPNTGLFFYTTNNNQLFRDIHVFDVKARKHKLLFEDCRVGHLTISPSKHEFWGIRHGGGFSTLMYSPAPYDSLYEKIHFDFGDEVQGLSISPSGKRLAAVLHRSNGEQSIVVVNADRVKAGEPANYTLITDLGSPENPSWSANDSVLFWNAYTNGVSNIYRTHLSDLKAEAVSHSLRGLFKPIPLADDSLFAFEFSSEGFIPVILPNKEAPHLPAISYFGQRVLDKFPRLHDLALTDTSKTVRLDTTQRGTDYNGFNHLKLVAFIPVLTGFENKKVIGLYSHISDPILNHDILIEAGISPFRETNLPTEFHLKLKYDYKKEFEIGWDYNAPDFYDLFNRRKRGAVGNKVRFGNTHYWIYDNPLKVKQLSELAIYSGFEFTNDNLVRVSQPDFFVAQTGLNSQSLRRTIGSSDFESGNEFGVTTMLFGSNPKNPQLGFQMWAEWDHFTPYVAKHNTAHLKLAAGYHNRNPYLLQSRFYFGGFGNRAVENVDVKQFRKVMRFPGIPIYSYAADRFAKFMFENNFPPIRFSNVSLSQHFLNHLDLSVFSQMLATNSKQGWFGIDAGIQLNFLFKHWFTLESTLSAGYARAWVMGKPTDEWFVSYKLLRN